MPKKQQKSWLDRLIGGPDEDPSELPAPERPSGFLERLAHDGMFNQPVVEGDDWGLDTLHSDIQDAWAELSEDELSYDELEHITIQSATLFDAIAQQHGYDLFWNVRGAEVSGDVSLRLDDDEVSMLYEWRDEAIEESLESIDE